MVLYTIKNLLSIKDILKTITSTGISKYIKILQEQRSRKAFIEPYAIFIEPCLCYKNIYR